MGKLLYEKESYEIRGACFAVYNILGGGIKESILEKALAKEIQSRGLDIDRQKRIDVSYKGDKIGVYIPDMVANDKILIEIKSKPKLMVRDKKQFWGYLKGSCYELGFLINFGTRGLEIERFIHNQK